jgi:hypothetical protein
VTRGSPARRRRNRPSTCGFRWWAPGDSNPEPADPALGILKLEKDAIETELGQLDWQELPTKRAGRVAQYREANIEERPMWPEYFDWLCERAEAFHRVFSPRIKALDLGAFEEEETESDEVTGSI